MLIKYKFYLIITLFKHFIEPAACHINMCVFDAIRVKILTIKMLGGICERMGNG